MPNTESEVIHTILKNGGKAKKGDMVKELGISLGYLDIITRSLERRGLVRFSNSVYFLTSLGKKKLAEFIQKTEKVKLQIKKKKERPKIRKASQKQKAELKDDNHEPKTKLIKQAEEPPKESPVEILLGQRIGELKERAAEAEKKIEEGAKKIEEKMEKELEKKSEATGEKIRPATEKIEELPPIILEFGKFLFITGQKVFDKLKKIKNFELPKLPALLVQPQTDGEKRVSKASLAFAKLRDFKVRDKLVFLSVWISKNYKNLTRKKS